MRSTTSTYLAAACLWLIGLSPGFCDDLYFIDAHSQVDTEIELDEVLKLMDGAGITRTILSARGRRDAEDIAGLAESHPDRITAAVRTKSRHYFENNGKYYKKLADQLNDGRFGAMAELLLYHAQKGDMAPEVKLFPGDAQVQAALNAARERGWPVIIHIEFAALSSGARKRYWAALKELLDDNPNYPVALIHMGQLYADDVRASLARHPNLYYLTSHSNPIATGRSRQPWINMFDKNDLAKEWVEVMISYPDHFIFAVDNVWDGQWRNGYREQVDLWRRALGKLPSQVAHAVAHGNAEKLWKLK